MGAPGSRTVLCAAFAPSHRAAAGARRSSAGRCNFVNTYYNSGAAGRGRRPPPYFIEPPPSVLLWCRRSFATSGRGRRGGLGGLLAARCCPRERREAVASVGEACWRAVMLGPRRRFCAGAQRPTVLSEFAALPTILINAAKKGTTAPQRLSYSRAALFFLRCGSVGGVIQASPASPAHLRQPTAKPVLKTGRRSAAPVRYSRWTPPRDPGRRRAAKKTRAGRPKPPAGRPEAGRPLGSPGIDAE